VSGTKLQTSKTGIMTAGVSLVSIGSGILISSQEPFALVKGLALVVCGAFLLLAKYRWVSG